MRPEIYEEELENSKSEGEEKGRLERPWKVEHPLGPVRSRDEEWVRKGNASSM